MIKESFELNMLVAGVTKDIERYRFPTRKNRRLRLYTVADLHLEK